MKLLTTLSALELLAPTTMAHRTAGRRPPARRHPLDGPCWKAAATRTLTATTWRRWRATCGRGIRHLAGDVVLDKQRFARTGSADDFASDSDKALPCRRMRCWHPESGVDHAVCAAGRRARGAGSAAGWTESGQPADRQPAGQLRRRRQTLRQPERTGDTLRLEGALPVGCDGSKLFAPVWEHGALRRRCLPLCGARPAAAWPARCAGALPQPMR